MPRPTRFVVGVALCCMVPIRATLSSLDVATAGAQPHSRALPRTPSPRDGSSPGPTPGVASAVQRALAKRGATLEYRWIDSLAVPNARYRDPQSGDALALTTPAVLTLADIDSVHVFRLRGPDAPSTSAVAVLPSRAGAQNFFRETSRRHGAVMAVVLNGVVIQTAIIQTTWATGVPVLVDVESVVAKRVADRLAGAMAARTK